MPRGQIGASVTWLWNAGLLEVWTSSSPIWMTTDVDNYIRAHTTIACSELQVPCSWFIPMVTELNFNLHKTQQNHNKWQKRVLPVYQNHFFSFNCQENSMNHFLRLKIMRVQTFFIFSASVSWKITFFGIIYEHFFVSSLILFFHSFSCESQRWMFSPRWLLTRGCILPTNIWNETCKDFLLMPTLGLSVW